MTAEECPEIAVVGASISGLYAALLLSRRGYAVTLYERATELDPAPRTLIVTSSLHPLLGDLADRCVVNRITRFDLRSRHACWNVSLRDADLVIERSVLIRDLAKECEHTGVAIKLGHRLEGIIAGGSGADLRLRSADGDLIVRPQVVIGADGASTAVGRSINGRLRYDTIPLVQAVVDLPPEHPPAESRVWFRPADTPYFYWSIPESPTHAVVGLIGGRVSARPLLDRFLAEEGFLPLDYQAARIPCYVGWRPQKYVVAGTPTYLVGDAAGHVKVSTVGGVVTGLRSALAAVAQICDGNLRPLRQLRMELGLHLAVRRVLHSFSDDDYHHLLRKLEGRLATALQRANRDQLPQLFFHLARARPDLVWSLSRNLTRSRRTSQLWG